MKLSRWSVLSAAFFLVAGCSTTIEKIPAGGTGSGNAEPGTDVDPTQTDDPAPSDEPDAATSDKPAADGGGTSNPKPPKDGGGGTPPATPGLDRTACTGTSSSSGSIYSTTPHVTRGSVITDPSSGGLRLVLTPSTAIATNDVVIGLYFTPIPGQLDYSPNGSVGCAVLRYTGSSWAVVDKTQLCELHFSQMQHASAMNVCDGTLAGTFNGIFTGNQPLAGAFLLPSNVAASQISAPSCRPYDSVCANHNECCSKSCSPVLGLCQ